MKFPPRLPSSASKNFHSSWLRNLIVGSSAALLAIACTDVPQLLVGDDSDGDGDSDGGGDFGEGGGLNLDGDGASGGADTGPVPYTCGDGNLEPGEFCDDGNKTGGDGCSKDCLTQNPDYDCSVPGEACVPLNDCGNGVIEGNELCDDGNESDGPDGVGDGCSKNCKTVQAGWTCARPGKPCAITPQCGNGLRERGEQCDEGQQSSGGCTADTCQITSAQWWCPAPGELCLEKKCGNGVRTPGEVCDDGGIAPGDGCSATCTQESGWICTGAGCRGVCGNSTVQTGESCDKGAANGNGTSGCTATCTVQFGYICTGNACTKTVCGNKIVEPGEACDNDDKAVAGDGCGPTCQAEPDCSDGTCDLACGDGLITGSEKCDDGNLIAGDGCSATCKVEAGFNCDNTDIDYPASINFAVTYRDFKVDSAPGGHPDFETGSIGDTFLVGPACKATSTECTAAPGVACAAGSCGYLDADRVPVYHRPTKGHIRNADTFKLWYFGANTGASPIAGDNGAIQVWQSTGATLQLNQVVGKPDTYTFASAAHYPLGNVKAGVAMTGHGDTCSELGSTTGDCAGNNPPTYTGAGLAVGRNYSFTTQLRYFFQYQGNEELTFLGDDDVWVFINGRLAVDISGIHGAETGRVRLGDDGDGAGGSYVSGDDSDCSIHKGAGNALDTACALDTEEAKPVNLVDDKRFGLTKGGVYEIVLFHAERQTVGSNFNLTLAGFLAPRSTCESFCGVNPEDATDTAGHESSNEYCDDGEDNSNTTYDSCKTDCSARIECGDSVVQDGNAGGASSVIGPEECDDGFNRALYGNGTAAGGCGLNCQLPPYCGDGSVQDAEEDCDTDSNDGSYNGCDTDCSYGPYCGDGVENGTVDHPETCDLGANNVAWSLDGTGCSWDCDTPAFCGDGIRYPIEEECDQADSTPDKAYGGCNQDTCQREPFCGDGKIQATFGEVCDDGPIGSLRCTSTCKPREEITR